MRSRFSPAGPISFSPASIKLHAFVTGELAAHSGIALAKMCKISI
jgi:hypothetical protein